MKRVRLTIHPSEADLPETFERVTGAAEEFVQVQVFNWNVTSTPVAFLLRVCGDIQRFESLLKDDDAVEEYELHPVDEHESYYFVTGFGSADAHALWENFKRGSLMTIPPAVWNADGTYTFTVVGRDADIQAAVERVPDVARVNIEAIGRPEATADSVRTRLSKEQRNAVKVGLELGYYAIPRKATSEDVAAKLGCATSTAAEHLRKAESKVFQRLFGESA
ncbi:helix-turn-helix domain-containing protein [Haloferacaceae archaeon DSL9]